MVKNKKLFMTKNQVFFSEEIKDANTFSKMFCASEKKTVICNDVNNLDKYLRRYNQVAVPFTSYVREIIKKIDVDDEVFKNVI